MLGSLSRHVRLWLSHPTPGLRIKENKEVYEGEVTELTPEYTEAVVRRRGLPRGGVGADTVGAGRQVAAVYRCIGSWGVLHSRGGRAEGGAGRGFPKGRRVSRRECKVSCDDAV